jgi:hypothetical protein
MNLSHENYEGLPDWQVQQHCDPGAHSPSIFCWQPSAQLKGCPPPTATLQNHSTLSSGVFLVRIVNSGLFHNFLICVANFSPSLNHNYHNYILYYYISINN